jgi:hypothetical protein
MVNSCISSAQRIESRTAEDIAQRLAATFERYCSKSVAAND